jgi:hypothetical protein
VRLLVALGQAARRLAIDGSQVIREMEGRRESSSGSLAFSRDQCNVSCDFDELDFGIRRFPRLGGVQGKGTKHLAILRRNRLGPRCANPVLDGKVF